MGFINNFGILPMHEIASTHSRLKPLLQNDWLPAPAGAASTANRLANSQTPHRPGTTPNREKAPHLNGLDSPYGNMAFCMVKDYHAGMAQIRFEWDDNKDAENQSKHRVSFLQAQAAFADPHRVIAKDLSHSETEERFYCMGTVAGGKKSSGSSEQATGERGKQSMKKKITYTDEPLGDIQVVEDFLPSPAELAFEQDSVKVTMALSKSSVDFFKAEASRHHTQYQRMIRKLLDAYVAAQGASSKGGHRFRG